MNDEKKLELVKKALKYYRENKWKALFGRSKFGEKGMCLVFRNKFSIHDFERKIPEIPAMMKTLYPNKELNGYWFWGNNFFSRIKLLEKVETFLQQKIESKKPFFEL